MPRATKIHDPQDSRLDKFYDETPQARRTFQLKTTTHRSPFELYYNVRLDGSPEDNEIEIQSLEKRAQTDMFNILLRLQARDEDCEFSSWAMLDEQGVILKQSNELAITVK